MKKIGLMTHVVIGYPSLEETVKTAQTMAESGVDFIELQIPFSDPLADGPTIMQACEESLKNDTKVKDAFIIMKKLSSEVSIPLLFMSYYNTVFRYGTEKFCRDAKAAGASGLIVPDMPIDEEGEEHFFALCKKYGLHAIHVISPASTDERMRKNAKSATGFIYCTSRQGTTGAKDDMAKDLENFLKRVRRFFNIPLAVGFGISKKEHISLLEKHADIAIIGSKIIDIIRESKSSERQANIRHFLHELNMVQ